MKRRGRPSDGVIINNLFTFATIVIIAITIVLYSTFIAPDLEEEKIQIKPLPCESTSYTKIKIQNEKLLKKSINAFNKGYYKVEGSFLKASKNSVIENVVSIEELNDIFISSINVPPKKDLQKFIKIKYEIIENDKNLDKNHKLNAGSIMTSFRINSNEIFFMQTDFKFMYKNAIKQRIDCSIKVYKNYVQN